MSEEKAKELNLKPLVRILASASAGVPPRVMGLGPVPATKKALQRAGLQIKDIGLVELNEAFAVQSLAVIEDLGVDPELVNVNGGAIAFGHPLGCSGARLMTTRYKDIDRDECSIGREVTVWGRNLGGRGGNIINCDDHIIQVKNRFGDVFTFAWGVVDRVEVEIEIPLDECIQYDPDVCEGEVDYFSPSGYGGPMRCRYHVNKRIESYENSIERYADSDIPPSWYDESYAGERWNDD